jgi:S-formylglutathione hydrolase FrmB
MKILFLFLAFLTACATTAIILKRPVAQKKLVQVYSNAMKRDIPAIILTPSDYEKTNDSLPVVYLLHGYSGKYSDWTTNVPNLLALVEKQRMIVVCPDGQNSWYFDSPIDEKYRFETHVSKEIVEFTDKHYRTMPRRSKRAICGLSMGGHGALFLAMRHPDIFGAAGSMSGGVDLNYSRVSWEIADRIGTYAQNQKYWLDWSVTNHVDLLKKANLALMIDCGVKDFFFMPNRMLHEKLIANDIPHEYTERPGEHNWAYWQNAIVYQLNFLHEFFEQKAQDVRAK